MHEPLIRNFEELGNKVAILGGTFDPVHSGHLAMGEKVFQETLPGAVLYLPAAQNPLKPSAASVSNAERLEMLRLALAPYPHFFVSDCELKRDGPSYAVETLRAIKKEMPKAQLSFICGADQLSSLHQWKNVEQIFSLATIVVLGRAGIAAADVRALAAKLSPKLQASLIENFIEFQDPKSATEIRAALAGGDRKLASAQLPPLVFDYIKARGLYRQKNAPRD